MIKSKRGISPLLATILLISFVIIIAILVWLWWGERIREEIAKQTPRNLAQVDCADKVAFRISNVVDDGVDLISFELYNEGDTRIDNFKALMSNDQDRMDYNVNTYLNEGATTTASANYSGIVSPTELTLIPILVRGQISVPCDEAQYVIVDIP